MASMLLTTTECMEEETYIKQLSTLSITNKNSVSTIEADLQPTIEADLQPAIAEEREGAATQRSEKVKETCNCGSTNAASKQKKNKNANLTKTSDLTRNNLKSNGSEPVQDGSETIDKNKAADTKETDHRNSLNNSKSNGTECVQDGSESTNRNDGADIKEIDHRDSLVRDVDTTDKQQEDITQAVLTEQRPITAETGAIPKTSQSNTKSIKAQRGLKNFDTQISTLSVDGGEQDGDSVLFQGSHNCDSQGQRLDPVPQMCNLIEPTMDTGFCSSQEPQDYSRFNTSRSEPKLTWGGDGGFNVFSGGRVTVKQLKLNLSATDLESDVGSLPSRGRNQAPTSAGGNINVFPGGNLQVGSIKGVTSDSCFEDAVIFSAESDNEVAYEFKRHLEEDIGCNNMTAALFEYIDPNRSHYGSLETMLERYRYSFVIVTKNLKNDKTVIPLLESLDADAWGKSWKEDRIIPVWTSKDKTFCPMVLKRLQGVPYYNREKSGVLKQMYLDGLKKQIEAVRKKSQDWERQMKENEKC